MSEPFLGEIKIVGFNFAPTGYAFCNGQLLSIAQNQALFALLGTTYGGNGQTTFALPNLQSRFPVHFGQGPGLSPYQLGQMAGQEQVTLVSTQIPSHTHALNCRSTGGNSNNPTGNVPSKDAGSQSATYSSAGANATMSGATIGTAGGGQPHDNLPPYLALNFIIALIGIFPSRS